MDFPLADYESERAAFAALLESVCEKRILFFKGESGTGKTSLLRYCQNAAKQSTEVLYVNTDLKGTAIPVAEILSRTSEQLGADRLPTLHKLVANIVGIPEVNLDDVKQTGLGNNISISLQVNNPNDKQQRQVALTEALFKDLRGQDQSVLFIFDTYQEATTEVQDWIGGPFLARVESASVVRVVMAGQKVPDGNNIDWGHCCTLHELRGVPNAKHWLPVIEAMKLRVPANDPLSWLVGICDALKGRPSAIMQHLRAEQDRSLRYE